MVVLEREALARRGRILWFVLLFVVLGVSVVVAMGIGQYEIAYRDMPTLVREYFFGDASLDSVIFVEGRLVRIVAAMCVGGALALSGALYQGIIGNPLVSPSILGVLSGASFGAALGMVLGFGIVGIEGLCFVFGIIAMGVSLGLAYVFDRHISVLMLILGGMISSAFFGAGVSVIKLLADPYNTLPNIVFWLMGSLTQAQIVPLVLLCAVLVLAILVSIVCASYLDVLNCDEESARALGVNIKYVRLGFILLATLLASLCVALGGLIGWVGLVIPHIARFIIGANHRPMLLFCACFGAVFLLVCDSIARCMLSVEIPIGIVSAFIGIPCFVVVLIRHKVARRI